MHSALLSAVAGYVDAAGFACLVGLFPAHMTGEIVGGAIAFSSGHLRDHAPRLWMLPIFVCAVALATFLARTLRRRGRRALTGLLALLTVGLALFSASDSLARLLHESWHLQVFLGGACAVTAMGFQNALMRESLAASCPTTVMTGNLTHVVIEVVDHLLAKITRPHLRDRKPQARLLPAASALFAFVTSAVLGGFLTRFIGSLSVALPTALTAALAFRSWRDERAEPAPFPKLPKHDPWRGSIAPTAPAPRVNPDTPETPSGAWLSSNTSPTEPADQASTEARRPSVKRTMSGTQLKSQRIKDE